MHPALSMFALQQDMGGSGGGMGAALGGGFFLVWLVVLFLCIAGAWKMFAKAGEPGWAAIVPIYNLFVLLKIVGKPIWWILLFIIPIVNFVILVITMVELAKRFGKGGGFAVGLILLGPIFVCILGFGDAVYTPPAQVSA